MIVLLLDSSEYILKDLDVLVVWQAGIHASRRDGEHQRLRPGTHTRHDELVDLVRRPGVPLVANGAVRVETVLVACILRQRLISAGTVREGDLVLDHLGDILDDGSLQQLL